MKKTMLVMALAAVLVLAFAGSAFAYTPTPVYIAWDGTGVNSAGPHADYQTTTEKCAVCHSVHIAPTAGYAGTTGGVAWTATAPTQLLLRGSAADSCKFCHIDTAVGGVQLYGGATGVYGTWGGPGHKGSGSSACVNCHAVHGANTFKGANTSKILRLSASGTRVPQPGVIASGADTDTPLFDSLANATVSNLKYEQQVVFCSECHGVFSRSADTTQASGFKGHSFVASTAGAFSAAAGGNADEYGAADAVVASTRTVNSGATISGMEVATTASSSCRACHTAGGTDQTGVSYNSFPHYTRGMPYFLAAGVPAGTVVSGTGATALDGVTDGSTADPSYDGNCTSCHTTVGTAF